MLPHPNRKLIEQVVDTIRQDLIQDFSHEVLKLKDDMLYISNEIHEPQLKRTYLELSTEVPIASPVTQGHDNGHFSIEFYYYEDKDGIFSNATFKLSFDGKMKSDNSGRFANIDITIDNYIGDQNLSSFLSSNIQDLVYQAEKFSK